MLVEAGGENRCYLRAEMDFMYMWLVNNNNNVCVCVKCVFRAFSL